MNLFAYITQTADGGGILALADTSGQFHPLVSARLDNLRKIIDDVQHAAERSGAVIKLVRFTDAETILIADGRKSENEEVHKKDTDEVSGEVIQEDSQQVDQESRLQDGAKGS